MPLENTGNLSTREPAVTPYPSCTSVTTSKQKRLPAGNDLGTTQETGETTQASTHHRRPLHPGNLLAPTHRLTWTHSDPSSNTHNRLAPLMQNRSMETELPHPGTRHRDRQKRSEARRPQSVATVTAPRPYRAALYPRRHPRPSRPRFQPVPRRPSYRDDCGAVRCMGIHEGVIHAGHGLRATALTCTFQPWIEGPSEGQAAQRDRHGSSHGDRLGGGGSDHRRLRRVNRLLAASTARSFVRMGGQVLLNASRSRLLFVTVVLCVSIEAESPSDRSHRPDRVGPISLQRLTADRHDVMCCPSGFAVVGSMF